MQFLIILIILFYYILLIILIIMIYFNVKFHNFKRIICNLNLYYINYNIFSCAVLSAIIISCYYLLIDLDDFYICILIDLSF